MAPSTTPQGGQKRKRGPYKRKKLAAQEAPTYSFPYFAHQQLDPEDFPDALGLPVGRPGWAPAPDEITGYDSIAWKDKDYFDEKFEPVDEELVSETKKSIKAAARVARQDLYKRLKTDGGRPAMAKKVTADLDSDDELIVRMKNAKYLERDIAKRLIDEGRIRYNAKTIGTRWARIKKKLAEKNDELLEAEQTDWHDGDDEALEQAKKRADAQVERLMHEANEKRWKFVAEELKTIKPVTNFSKNACKNRYEARLNGTAKPTPESVENPDEATRASIESRKQKEVKIEQDQEIFKFSDTTDDEKVALAKTNLKGNAWTSKRGRGE